MWLPRRPVTDYRLPVTTGHSRAPNRVMLVGAVMLGVGIVSFVVWVVVAIASDNTFALQWLPAVVSWVLVPLGLLAVAAGLLWQLAAVVRDARVREDAAVADMAAATTPQQALAVQSRASAWSWRRRLAIAALCSPAVPLVFGFGRYEPVVWIASLAAAAVAVLAFSRLATRRTLKVVDDAAAQQLLAERAAQVAAVAAAQGWAFQAIDRRADPNGTARNSMAGVHDDVPFVAYDRVREASRTTVNGRVTSIRLATDTVVQVPFAAAFKLAVVPETFGADVRWGQFGSVVDLESGDFNDAYQVYCLDHYRARLVLNPAVMQVLASNPGHELVVDRGLLRLTRTDELAPPERLVTLVDLAARVARSARAAHIT